jgi:NADPH-dependent 2,4-dienoyl-CoA reductase/sulfur reductase-like enzyme
VVVVAIGAAPATDWLTDSGLTLDDGVVCDATCTAAEGIYAAGDVARWHHTGLDVLMRLQNRTNATDQATAVAEAITGSPRPYTPVGYFWSDQYDNKIQVYGHIGADAVSEVVDGDAEGHRFVTRFESGGVVTAVLGWNMPKQSRMQSYTIGAAAMSEGVKTA